MQTTKLARVLKRHGVPTSKLIAATRKTDPRGRGYSRTYVYGLCRGEVENPTQRCMTVIAAAARDVTGDRSLSIADVFEFSAPAARRKAS
jgi:hypothetical protein